MDRTDLLLLALAIFAVALIAVTTHMLGAELARVEWPTA